MRYLALIAFLATPVAAAAQPGPNSIKDCESIKGDLAYNQCLAMFGPKVGERRSSAAAAAAANEDEPVAQRGPRGGRYAYRRGRGGRQSASFEVGSRKVQAARTSVRAKRSYTKRSYRRRR